jgi:hypothetical protein
VVTVFGKQSGAAVGYNPTKHGRPSYSYHSFFIGGLRLPLDVEAKPGNQSHGVHGAEALWHLLYHRLPSEGQPWCIRGDMSYANSRPTAWQFDQRESHNLRNRNYLGRIPKWLKGLPIMTGYDTR